MKSTSVSSAEWGVLHKAAKRTINAIRRHYLLSTEECEDCINSLVVEYAPKLDRYKPSEDGMSLETWLIDSMRRRVPRIVAALRSAGFTGEIDDALQLCSYDDYVPEPRGMGDQVYHDLKKEDQRPTFADVLTHQQTTQTVDELAVDALLDRLPPDEAQLLIRYYGLNGEDPLTQLELALATGVSQQAIQLRLRGISEKLRRGLYKFVTQGSINRDMENINATVRKVRRA